MKLPEPHIKDRWIMWQLVLLALGFAAHMLCYAILKDTPLLRTLATTACYLPFWICILWPKGLVVRNDGLSMPKLSRVWLCCVVIFGGMSALNFASDIYHAAAQELTLLDTAGTSGAAIQALHMQANELNELVGVWMAVSFSAALLAGIMYGLIWIRANLAASAAALKSTPPVPQPDPDEIFVVGDRNQQATATTFTKQTG